MDNNVILNIFTQINYKNTVYGNSLVVQRLGLCTLLSRAQVQSLVRELRSHKLQGKAKNDGVGGAGGRKNTVCDHFIPNSTTQFIIEK